MPVRRKKSRFDDAEVCVAVESFAVDLDGATEHVRAGTRLLGSNALVKGWPTLFGRESDPADVARVRRQLRDEASAQAAESVKHDTKPATVLGSIPTEHRLRAVRDSLLTDPATGHGVVVHCGEICDARSDLVKLLQKAEPDLFEEAND